MSTRSTIFRWVSDKWSCFAIKRSFHCIILLTLCLSFSVTHKELIPADNCTRTSYITSAKSPVNQEGLPAIMVIIVPFIEPKAIRSVHLILPCEEEKSKRNLFSYKSLKIENIYLLIPFIHSP